MFETAGQKLSVMYAAEVITDLNTHVNNLFSAASSQEDKDAAAKALMVEKNRFFGVLESTGGGKTTATDTVTAWGPDATPQPLLGDTTLNDFTIRGYYNVKDLPQKPTDQSNLSMHDEAMLNATHGSTWIFITAVRKNNWVTDGYFISCRKGSVNGTGDDNQSNPYDFSITAQQDGDSKRLYVSIA